MSHRSLREDYVRDVMLDLPALAVAFARRLHDVGMPVPAERSARFAQALQLVKPVSKSRLYCTARAAFVSDQAQLTTFDRVFTEVFGAIVQEREVDELRHVESGDDERPVVRHQSRLDEQDKLVPTLASADEVLRHKRFDALEPHELAQLRRMMARLSVVTPTRHSRRRRRDSRGERVDVRRTLHESMRTGGDPIRLARRRRPEVPRRLVLLCDISGSMEPYARAYLQFLACAAGGGRAHVGRTGSSRHEAFAFATRLTRLTRALHSRSPERAIQRAANAAPDWSSGTRIGEALKTFNDRHGRRGMARGAVVVILSDGWERGDPALVGEQMKRLSRLAHRIVWVNPRAAGSGFEPRAAGMTAALPYIDSLISGESLAALAEVVEAIGAPTGVALPGAGWEVPEPRTTDEDEPWASATPVAGSSVAMPSGTSPSRGNTTPGWQPAIWPPHI